jgi:hypothetical protein
MNRMCSDLVASLSMNRTRSDPVTWLPVNTTLFPLFRPSRLAADEQDAIAAVHCLSMSTSPDCTYARVRVRDPARMYVRGRIFWHVVVRMCTRFRRDCLNYYVGGSTTTRAAACSAMVHRCRETDRPVCTYKFATTLRTLRPGGSRLSGRIRTHFLASEVIVGGSELSGGGFIFFAPNMEALSLRPKI